METLPDGALASRLAQLAIGEEAVLTPRRQQVVASPPATDLRLFSTPIAPTPKTPPTPVTSALASVWPVDVPDDRIVIPLLERVGRRERRSAEPTAVVLLVFDSRMLMHVSPAGHVEEAARIRAIFARLVATGALAPSQRGVAVDVRPARFCTREEVKRVHTDEHIRSLLALDTRDTDARTPGSALKSPSAISKLYVGPRFSLDEATAYALFNDATALPYLAKRIFAGRASGDMYSCDYTPAVALLAAGGVLRAVDAVARAGISRTVSAFAVVRPPGHHCTADSEAGFCWLSNVAIGVRHAQAVHGVRRIAILDWDVHHGDGTCSVFEGDPDVLVISIHRHDDGSFYPYGDGGAASNVGVGAGAGNNVNIAWPCSGIGDVEYAAALECIVLPIIAEFSPEMLFVSSGFDAADGDQLGGMRVTPRGFRHAAALAAAVDPPRGTVIVLEGGYNHSAIAASAEEVVRALKYAASSSRRLSASEHIRTLPERRFLRLRHPSTPLPRYIHGGALVALSHVVEAHAAHWRCVAELAESSAWLGAAASETRTSCRTDGDSDTWPRYLQPPGRDAAEVARWERCEVSLLLVPVAKGRRDSEEADISVARCHDVEAAGRRALAPLPADAPIRPASSISITPTRVTSRSSATVSTSTPASSGAATPGNATPSEAVSSVVVSAATTGIKASAPVRARSDNEVEDDSGTAADDDLHDDEEEEETAPPDSSCGLPWWKPMTPLRSDRYGGGLPEGVVVVRRVVSQSQSTMSPHSCVCGAQSCGNDSQALIVDTVSQECTCRPSTANLHVLVYDGFGREVACIATRVGAHIRGRVSTSGAPESAQGAQPATVAPGPHASQGRQHGDADVEDAPLGSRRVASHYASHAQKSAPPLPVFGATTTFNGSRLPTADTEHNSTCELLADAADPVNGRILFVVPSPPRALPPLGERSQTTALDARGVELVPRGRDCTGVRGFAPASACVAAVREWSRRSYYTSEDQLTPSDEPHVPRVPPVVSDVIAARFTDDDVAITAIRINFGNRDAAKRFNAIVAQATTAT